MKRKGEELTEERRAKVTFFSDQTIVNKQFEEIRQQLDLNDWRNKWKLTNEASSLLMAASALAKLEVIEFLLSGSSKFSIKDIIAPTKDGENALHLAAQYGHVEIAKFILESEHAQEFIKPNQMGVTALHAAALAGQLELAQIILSYRPDLAQCGAQISFTIQNNQLMSMREFLTSYEFALLVGMFDIDGTKKYLALDKLLWNQTNQALLKNILLNKTNENRQSANEILKMLAHKFPEGHESIDLLREYLIGYDLKNIIMKKLKDIISCKSFGSRYALEQYYAHEILVELEQRSKDGTLSLLEDLAKPGVRIHC